MSPAYVSAAAVLVSNLQENAGNISKLSADNGMRRKDVVSKGTTARTKRKGSGYHKYNRNDNVCKVDLMDLNLSDLADGHYIHAHINVPSPSPQELERIAKGELTCYGIKFHDPQIRLVYSVKRAGAVDALFNFLSAFGVDFTPDGDPIYTALENDYSPTSCCRDVSSEFFTLEWGTQLNHSWISGDIMPYIYNICLHGCL